MDTELYYQTDLPPIIREAVFERDDYKCRRCNSSRGIAPHHIIYRSERGSHDPENLVTLCFDCHRRIHDGYMIVRRVGEGFFFGGTNL